MDEIFITGLYRSGTTLVEKILSNHPEICIGSQPFPFLYFQIKKDFYWQKGINRVYPLDHLFLEEDYTLEELNNFIEIHSYSKQRIQEIFYSMKGYIGHWTPELNSLAGKLKGGTFLEIYSQLSQLLFTLFEKKTLKGIGVKEIYCEEFMPFLLANNRKVVLVIRDPRDIITSLNFGKGVEYTGKIRPTLFTIRAWRKSVSFAIACADNPNFFLIKYEDLVKDPWSTLRQLTHFLDVPDITSHIFDHGIYDQFGKIWKGNSSFGNYSFIDDSSLGKYKDSLGPDLINYIETLCGAELDYLKYKTIFGRDKLNNKALRSFKEPFDITREDFEGDYSHSRNNIEVEIQRLKYLYSQTLDTREVAKWFIFPEAYETLKRSISLSKI